VPEAAWRQKKSRHPEFPQVRVRSGSDKHGQIVPQRIKNGLSVPLRSNKLHPDVALSRLGQREQEGTGGYAGEPFGIGSPNNKGAEFQDAGA